MKENEHPGNFGFSETRAVMASANGSVGFLTDPCSSPYVITQFVDFVQLMTDDGVQGLDSPPPQQIFALNLTSINENRAILSTLGGQEVTVGLNFQPHTVERDVGSSVSKGPEAFMKVAQGVTRMRSKVGPIRELGLNDTVKDLGMTARLLMGLPPRTPLGVTTRVMAENEVLSMWRPIITLIRAPSDQVVSLHYLANITCHFCHATMNPVRDEPLTEGPFRWCFFCEDYPAWHHGRCCPYNWTSAYCRGASHKEKYEIAWHNQRRRVQGPGLPPTGRFQGFQGN